MTKLRLFIWTDFMPDWQGGLAFSIAANKAEAKKLVEKKVGREVIDWGTLTVKPVSRRCAAAVGGGS